MRIFRPVQPPSENGNKIDGTADSMVLSKACRGQWLWYCCAAVFTVKCLVVPCYHSTDFEVHRNWLAITHTLPLRSWYYDNTSYWTLDYPPFFAFFEYLLSQVASFVVPSALVLQGDAYFTNEVLLFQRFSVIVVDIFYVLSCFFLAKSFPERWTGDIARERNSLATELLLVANVSLVMIDNIHFQYNGILSALLLFSLGCIMRKSFLLGALSYCVLLNMKHIYLYYAPAYLLFYAVNYLLPSRSTFTVRFIKLAAVISLSVALSFGPFLYFCGSDFVPQIWARLFPFKRGLTHAYWAPNLWALYNFVDWYFYQILKLTKRLPPNVHPPSYTSGLVQEFSHSVLPSVSPFGAMLTTGALLLPMLPLVRTRHIQNVSLLLTLSAFAFFLAGYHVHEKGIILITIPYTILASLEHRFLPSYLLLSLAANVSLFPLFFTPFEDILKIAITLCYLFFSRSIMRFLCPERELCALQKIYMYNLLVIQVYCVVLHQLIFGTNFTFIPLMLTSLTTAVGICWVYLELLWFITFEGLQNTQTACICEKKQKLV